MLTACQVGLHRALLVHEHPAQAVAGRTSLPEAEFDQPALTSEHLRRQLSAVLPGHGALDALDDGRHRRAVVLELFGTVRDLYPGTATDVLVVRAFVGILEAPPPTDVVDEDDLEVGRARFHVLDQALQRLSAIDPKPALAFVGIRPDDFDAALRRVFLDLVALVLGRVLLVLGRHAHVPGSPGPCSRRVVLVGG